MRLKGLVEKGWGNEFDRWANSVDRTINFYNFLELKHEA